MSELVLLTGAAGFIGTALARQLTSDGHTVVGVDSLHPQVHPVPEWPHDYPEAVQRITGDITEPQMWDALLAQWRPDVVVHLAAETATGQSLAQSSRHARVNVAGTAELLDGLTRAGHVPRKIVLPSSRAVYGEGRWADAEGRTFYPPGRPARLMEAGIWLPEAPADAAAPIRPLPHRGADTQPRPSNIYAATKLAQEHILESWAAAMGAELTVLRFQNVYGPGQSLTNPYTGMVSLFGRLALRGEAINVYEDGEMIRDFVFIDDIVAALAAAIPGEGAPHPIDVGSGTPATLLEVATTLARLAGGPDPFISGQYRAGDVRAAFADVEAAHRVLGYVPQVSLDEGLQRLLAWIGANDTASGAAR